MAWTLLLSCCSNSTTIRTPPPLALPLRTPPFASADPSILGFPNPRREARRRGGVVVVVVVVVVVGGGGGGGGWGAGDPGGAVAAEAAYVVWLFLLPYAPGDPVWAIKQSTISDLLGLSLNFFFILPLMNSVGIHVIEAPVLHPVAEGLFNFVIGWTFLFAPLLFTDRRRDRYKGSLDLLWGCQMFLTNVFLIPYMAIRLNDADSNQSPTKPSQLGSVMVRGAPIVV
uniref:Uncharacterized protein n=1 Tax=Ananas comosus var. bracteatus TaxID=296719 RepID=A0A6V7P328_ANACO|nr:unnamed protein product [Ananas comosus var. bracteatus]